jgi:hypothetical protein
VLQEAKGVSNIDVPIPKKAEDIAKKGQEVAKKLEEAPKTNSIPSQDDKASEKAKLDTLLTDLDKLLADGQA